MNQEKRTTDDQSQSLMLKELTDAQRAAINQLERFGWDLSFVRRPLFKDVIPVLKDPEHDRYAVMEADGSLNEDHHLIIRDKAC